MFTLNGLAKVKSSSASVEECWKESDVIKLVRASQLLSAATRHNEAIICALDVVADLIAPTELKLYLGTSEPTLTAVYVNGQGSQIMEGNLLDDPSKNVILKVVSTCMTVVDRKTACVPIMEDACAIGCIVIANSARPTVASRDICCTQMILGQLVITLSNARLLKTAENLVAKHQQLIEHLPCMIFDTTSDRTSSYHNKALREYTGMTTEQLSHGGWLSAIHPDDTEAMKNLSERLFETGESVDTEARVRCKEGSYRRFVLRAVPVRDEQAAIVRFIGTCFDIELSPQSISKSHLYSMMKTTEERFRQLFVSNIVSIFFADAEGFINDANDSFLDLVGLTRDELLVKRRTQWADLTIPEHAYLDAQALDEISKAGVCHALEKQIRLPSSDTKVWVIFGAASIECPEPFPTRSSVTRMVGFMMDITVRKEMENEVFLATSAKSQFLATMSHELRTPFSGVLGMISLLSETRLDPTQREYVETCQQSCTNLLEIIDNILDFSKLEAGKVKLESVPLDPYEVIADISDLLIVLSANNGLDLGWLVDHNVPRCLLGDPKRIRQNLLNLIGNALKFTHKGEVYTRCTLLSESETEAVLKFEIIDTGIGLTPEQQVGLFMPFKQVDSSTTRVYGGTGLGLGICKQITELMDGEIGVISEKDKGSNFWFTARLKKLIRPAVEESPVDFKLSEDLRVLILSNSEMKAEHLKRTLIPLSCHVVLDPSQVLSNLLEARSSQRPYNLLAITHDNRAKILKVLHQINAQAPLAATTFVLILSPPVTEPVARKDQLTFFRECESSLSYLQISLATQPPHRERLMRSIQALLNSPVSPLSTYLESCWEKVETDPADIGILDECVVPAIAPATVDVASELARIQRKFSDPGPLASLIVLVAEDNPIAQKLVTKQLQRYGCRTVCIVEDGEEVVKRFKSEYHRLSIVLMDLHMPLLDGLEATRQIRVWEKESSASRRVPILALTADMQQSTREECLRAGMDGALNKPVNQKELLSVVLYWTTHNQSWGI